MAVYKCGLSRTDGVLPDVRVGSPGDLDIDGVAVYKVQVYVGFLGLSFRRAAEREPWTAVSHETPEQVWLL